MQLMLPAPLRKEHHKITKKLPNSLYKAQAILQLFSVEANSLAMKYEIDIAEFTFHQVVINLNILNFRKMEEHIPSDMPYLLRS
jgi:hypothetical protein